MGHPERVTTRLGVRPECNVRAIGIEESDQRARAQRRRSWCLRLERAGVPFSHRLAARCRVPVRPEPPMWQIWVAFVYGCAMLAILIAIMPSYWRRPNKNLFVTPALWVWGDSLWRGFVRAIPAICLSTAMVLAMGLYMLVVGRDRVNDLIFWTWFVLLMVGCSTCIS